MEPSAASETVGRTVTVRGRVQGVNFRDATRRLARSVGVAGWARNVDDGTVRLRLEGHPDAVARVIDFVHTGPPHAVVSSVDVVESEVVGYPDFRIG